MCRQWVMRTIVSPRARTRRYGLVAVRMTDPRRIRILARRCEEVEKMYQSMRFPGSSHSRRTFQASPLATTRRGI
jgi:hypothetical protein